jgi:hypothetical protein
MPSPDQLLRTTRRLSVAFGVLQTAIGIWAITLDASVIGNALTIAGYSAGLLLGLFLLSVLTQTVTGSQALIGAACGLVVLLFIHFALPSLTRSATLPSGVQVAWPWFALIGSSTTFFVGVTLATLFNNTARTGAS